MALRLPTRTKKEPYITEPNRWYQAFPYGFAHTFFDTKKDSIADEIFWLPIAPSNINTTTHFATNIVTTLYGVIEEHSEVRYYDIVISGNTGIAPKFITSYSGHGDVPATNKSGHGTANDAGSPADKKNPGTPSTGRDSFKPEGGLASSLRGFLPEVTNTISAAANLISDMRTGGNDKNITGIRPEQSGYLAFHNFYKFLLKYKNDAATAGSSSTSKKSANLRKNHPLQFLNYKDNIKYDVIPISFTLTRSAENPMLYVYNIKLRAFNLQTATTKAPDTVLLSDLGLGALEGSLFSKITGRVKSASTLLSGIGGIR